MKQIYMLALFFTILVVSKGYNLRNSNQMENRIESNYSNLLETPEPNNNQKQENEQTQIKKLKGIMQELVKKFLIKIKNLKSR